MELKSLAACAGNQSVSLLALVLLGRRNSGKTSAGNTILGRMEFETRVKTRQSVKKHSWVDGVRVAVVDTPGWSAFGLANTKQVRQEVLRSEMFSSVGHRVFLLVIPVDAFSSRDRQAVEENLSVLGFDVWKHTMVLFTWGDELRGKNIEEHIKKSGKHLQKILEMCGYRYHVINNKATDNYSQVSLLIQAVKQMC
ncbi:GTPase IMAP family member 4 [Colossoma macropomum]|uniref:GTPase IMAP family member 4 n=1 Tax=Colossoma macropomum TaxID=42526 RepID=UPI001863FC4E|nr:GTPase IMAP family member 4 [Colossoma macropomum]